MSRFAIVYNELLSFAVHFFCCNFDRAVGFATVLAELSFAVLLWADGDVSN